MPFPRIVRFNAYELNLHTAELKARASNKVAAAAVAHPSLAGNECGTDGVARGVTKISLAG